MPNFKEHLQSIISKHVGAIVDETISAYKAMMAAQFGERVQGSAKHSAAAAKAPARRGGRRSSKTIAGVVDHVLAFIAKHPGLRSEQIMKQLGGDKDAIRDALGRLRAAKKVKTKGIKRAMTYRV